MFMDIQLTFVVWFGFVSRHVVVHKFGMHSNQPNWCLLCSFKLKRANFLQHVRFRMPFLGWGWWFDVGRSSVQFCFIFEPFSLKCVFRVTAFAGLVYFWTIPGTQRPIFESFELFAKAQYCFFLLYAKGLTTMYRHHPKNRKKWQPYAYRKKREYTCFSHEQTNWPQNWSETINDFWKVSELCSKKCRHYGAKMVILFLSWTCFLWGSIQWLFQGSFRSFLSVCVPNVFFKSSPSNCGVIIFSNLVRIKDEGLIDIRGQPN